MFKKIFTGYFLIGLLALMLSLSVPTSSIDSVARKSRLNSNDNVSTISIVPEPIQNENFPFVSEFSSVYDLVYCNYFYVPREDDYPVNTYFCLYFFPSFNYQNVIEWSLGLSSIKVDPSTTSFPIITDLAYSYLDLNIDFDFSNDFCITSFSVSLPYLNDQESFELEFEFEFTNSDSSTLCYLYAEFEDYYQYYEICDLGLAKGSFTDQIRYFDDNFVLPIGSDHVYPISSFFYNSTVKAIKAVSDYSQYLRGYDFGYDLGYSDGVDDVASSSVYSGQFYVDNFSQYCTTILYEVGNSFSDTDVTPFINDWYDNGLRFRSLMYNAYEQLFANELSPTPPNDNNTVEFVFNFDNYLVGDYIDLSIYGFNQVIFTDVNNNQFIIDIPRTALDSSYNLKPNLTGLLIKYISFVGSYNFHYDNKDDFYKYNIQPYIINNYVSEYNQGYNDGVNSQLINLKNKDEQISSLNDEIDNLINGVNEDIKNKDKEIAYLKDRLESLTNDDFTLANLFWSIGSVPFETIKTIWNFEFLGVNLTQFFTGLITCLLLIYLIKKLFFK